MNKIGARLAVAALAGGIVVGYVPTLPVNDVRAGHGVAPGL